MIAQGDPTPPRPAPPPAIIAEEQERLGTLERRVETQYKKITKTDRQSRATPPRPSPPRAPQPPQRSSSREQVKSCPATPRSTKKQILIRAVRTPSPNTVKYVAAESPEPRPHSGTFVAMPATVESPGPRDFEGGNTRRAFVDSMLKAEQVSAEITRKMDGVRSHRVKELQDLKETDRKAERAIKSELERRQQEVEGILKKKKDEEHLKRLEFEEQRIKEENEKMKRDAEEKRKRDLEDARLQELLKLKEESKSSAV